MKLQTHPHKSDTLWLSKEDIDHILNGVTLRAGALDVKLEIPDKKELIHVYHDQGVCVSKDKPNLKLTFDGETGKLKSAEVL